MHLRYFHDTLTWKNTIINQKNFQQSIIHIESNLK